MTGIISGFPGLGRVYQAEERLTKPHWQVDEPGWGWGGVGRAKWFVSNMGNWAETLSSLQKLFWREKVFCCRCTSCGSPSKGTSFELLEENFRIEI